LQLKLYVLLFYASRHTKEKRTYFSSGNHEERIQKNKEYMGKKIFKIVLEKERVRR
jgi:hypothetical protein